MVMTGYNHGVEPAPLRLYVGKKGVDGFYEKQIQKGRRRRNSLQENLSTR